MKLGQDVCFDISLKIIHGLVGVKRRSQGQILEKACFHSRGHFLAQFSGNFVRMLVLMISWSSSIRYGTGSKVGHRVKSSRSLLGERFEAILASC